MDGSRMRSGGGTDTSSSNASNRMIAFEDEKRRIMESCFTKLDETGAKIESYITHLRIFEFGNYPSSPPPPGDTNAAKKERYIIVAVKTSGKLRIHKARENQNGSFSIGKTWQLDDLTAFRSYTVPVTGTPEENEQRQWAEESGFTITLGKLYYWQAMSPKEKQFFIASIVKIYSKYTGGSYPQFSGFTERELDQFLAPRTVGQSSLPQQQQMRLQAPQQSPQPSPSSPLPNPPYAQPQNRAPARDPSREPRLRQQPSQNPVQRPPNPPSISSSSYTSQRPPPSRERKDASPGGRPEYGAPGTPQSNSRMAAGSNQSQESLSTDSSSIPPRSRNGMNGIATMPGRFPGESITPTSLRAMTPESNYRGSNQTASDVPPVPSPVPLAVPPERRRPPMPPTNDSGQRGLDMNENFVPAPLASSARKRDDLRPVTPGSDSLSIRTKNDQTRTPESEPQPFSNESSEYKTTRIEAGRGSDAAVPSESKDQVAEEVVATNPLEATKDREQTPSALLGTSKEDAQNEREPMIKKKLYANKIMSAAKAVSAFTPRAGGAGQRRQNLPTKASDGPDGITGVVPAPSLLRSATDDSMKAPTPISDTSSNQTSKAIPEVKITQAPAKQSQSIDGPIEMPKEAPPEKSKVREVRRQKPPAEVMDKELRAIGIDPNVLGDRGGDLVNAWEEFGFAGQGLRSIDVDKLQEQVQQELNKIQTGSDFLKFMNEQDDRVESVHKGFDVTLEACEEFDALLTLYLVELDTLTPDIAYIEAQSQGLQVQAANQKLLQAELESLLQTISISSDQLSCLRDVSIGDSRGLEQIESSLVMLYKAMITIDPTLSASNPRPSEDGSVKSGARSGYENSDIGKMRVLQEKKDVYQNESALFLQRLKSFLQIQFAVALDETRKALDREKSGQLPRSGGKAHIDPRNHDLARAVLWKYNPLMLFSREVDRFAWEEFMKSYEFVCKGLYQGEFQDAMSSWQRLARKPTGDEGDILFSSQQEKQTENLATTARKLTVKRSQTLAKSLRSPVGDGGSKVDKSSDGRLHPYEVFSGILEEIVPIVTMEQNFIVEFFHVSSLEQHDFPEAVALALPDARRGGDLKRVRVMEPQRELARHVVQAMEDIYSFLPSDLQKLVDQTIRADALQGIGVIAAIERKLLDLEETSQEYLNQTLQKVHSRLLTLFNKFLDEQIRAIEETKVKINKRKGVIAFVRIFPSFSTAIETMLVAASDLEIRTTVNNAYIRINKAMFESLKVIARETPGAQTASADPEDKEALNYQILLIENMNHYLEEVDTRGNQVLEDWKSNAAQEMDEHMNLYLNAVIRRPLGKLLDTLESTESLMASRQAGEGFSKIAAMPSHSKNTFKKVLQNYDAKEIRKGVESLKRRIAKHFGEGDEIVNSQGLVTKVLSNCERFYERVEERILIISRDIYDGEVVAEWTRADVAQAFRSK